MNSKARFITLVAILVCVTLISTGIAISALYRASVAAETQNLLDLVRTQARTFETIARNLPDEDTAGTAGTARGDPGGHEQGGHEHGAVGASAANEPPAIRAIISTHEAHGTYTEGTGIALARRVGNEIRFIMSHFQSSHLTPQPVPVDSVVAKPVLRALDGETGTMFGKRTGDIPALIAFDKLRGSDSVLLGSIDLAALRAPFIRAGAIAGTVAIILIVIGALLFNRIFGQILKNLEAEVKQRTAELGRELDERKTSEEALRLGETRFRAIVDNTAEGIVLIDAAGSVEFFNRASVLMFGYAENEILGREFSLLISPSMREEISRHLESVLHTRTGGVNRNREFTALRRNSTEFPIELHVAPMVLEGEPKFVAIVRDITNRRIAEEAVRRSEEKFRRAFEDAQTGVLICDPAGLIMEANRAFCAMVGYEEKELIGLRPAVDLTHPDDIQNSVWAHRSAIQNSGADFAREEKRYLRKDGTTVWAAVTYSFIRDEDGSHAYTVGHIEDVSERISAQTALAESEERFRRFFEDATIPMSVASLSGKFTQVNRALGEFLGYSEEELMKLSVDDILVAEDAAASNRERGDLVKGQFRVRSIERRYRHRDGSTRFGIANRGVVLDAAGNPASIITQVQDISERKAAEQARTALEAELRQTQKLEAIGQLAAGIAHEINTPVQYIGDNLRFVQDAFGDISELLSAYGEFVAAAEKHAELSGDLNSFKKNVEGNESEYLLSEIPASLSQSLEGVDQVARIVSAMRDFSHPGQKDKSNADINRALENTIMVCRNTWKHVAELETDFDADLPHVECLVGELNQVFLNLIINASHAIESAGRGSEGKIAVSTRRDGDWIDISISDNGIGIPRDIQSRIFEPFFTTKGVGKGTGQGLAVSYDVIVNKHGGKISFDSRDGAGTEFVVRLPIVETDAKTEAA